ncbi:MAG TPA: hypothetical protein VHN99_05485 [Deinococcales bacterium]|nr:hypothetical protein [Deinococcales bacterium]
MPIPVTPTARMERVRGAYVTAQETRLEVETFEDGASRVEARVIPTPPDLLNLISTHYLRSRGLKPDRALMALALTPEEVR